MIARFLSGLAALVGAGGRGRYTEPGEHRVVLQIPGPNQLLLVREIRRTTGLTVPQAVKLLADAPVVLVEGLSETSAELVADRLRSAGARALAAPIEEY